MEKITNICWIIATILLLISGIYFTIKLKFPQFDIKRIIKSLKNDNKDKEQISPFQTLTLALAARIGVGSLSGIAIGLYKGGPGIIFWLCLSSLITIPNSFVESTLAVKYHEKKSKYYEGGPAHYISKGLNNKSLAIIYAITLAFCYLGCFLAIQSNTIASSLKDYYGINPLITGIFVAIIAFLIIFKGLKSITNATSKLVPVMGIAYMLVAITIIIMNINIVPSILYTIIKEAFNVKAMGWGILTSIILGVQRGIFSSEAGIGTGAVASGAADTNNPIKQGYLQMLGVYFTSFIVCTSTAIIILTSKIDIHSFIDPNGIEITGQALTGHLGSIGTIILMLSIISFAFSTIISGFYYGETNLKYILKKYNRKTSLVVKILVTLIILYGAIARPSILWDVVDIGVGLLAIINIIAILSLRHEMVDEFNKGINNYDK